MDAKSWALTERIIGACIEVHRELGPGLLESAYEDAVCMELSLVGLRYARQVHVPLHYKGTEISSTYVLDLIVEGLVVMELKAVEALKPIHEAQLLTYLRASRCEIGLLVNFHAVLLGPGVRRMTLQRRDS